LGCTVIELLDGKPPYYKLQPMPALFRIVNDDHPPLPESISPVCLSIRVVATVHQLMITDRTRLPHAMLPKESQSQSDGEETSDTSMDTERSTY